MTGLGGSAESVSGWDAFGVAVAAALGAAVIVLGQPASTEADLVTVLEEYDVTHAFVPSAVSFDGFESELEAVVRTDDDRPAPWAQAR
jgi:hypothetical protein